MAGSTSGLIPGGPCHLVIRRITQLKPDCIKISSIVDNNAGYNPGRRLRNEKNYFN